MAFLELSGVQKQFAGGVKAVENFDLAPWLERHGELFNDLLVQRQRR